MTVRDLVRGSLRLIGAVASGETPSANEQSDALSVLNDMLDSWTVSGLLIFETARESFALTPGKQTYTLGSGGDFNTARPIQITDATIEQNGNEIPLEIINTNQWSEVNLKNTQSTIPQKMFLSGDFPLDQVSLWPLPSVANNLILYSLKPLGNFTTASDSIVFPQGYARALRYNLALELALEFGKEPSPTIQAIAMESKAELMRLNIQPVYMKSDATGITSSKMFNWLTGK